MPTIDISYALFDRPEDLPTDEAQLLLKALEVAGKAYAPFSHFHVGCALQLSDGTVLTGNNQENLAFPSGLCAERTALYYAGSLGQGAEVRKIAIRAYSDRKPIDVPVMPCGACRQVMVEYENMAERPFIILSQGVSGQIMRLEGVKATLMPFNFEVEF
jgi:cytidine deaminase